MRGVRSFIDYLLLHRKCRQINSGSELGSQSCEDRSSCCASGHGCVRSKVRICAGEIDCDMRHPIMTRTFSCLLFDTELIQLACTDSTRGCDRSERKIESQICPAH